MVATRRSFFKQHERLKRKKLIRMLFSQGAACHFPPIRVVYLRSPVLLTNHQFLFSAPRKRVKRAVDRNTLKRRMREAYRLHKGCLSTNTACHLLVGYIYTGPALPSSFAAIEKGVIAALRHLNKAAQQPSFHHEALSP